MNLLERVLTHEGFEARPYQDHLGNWTFGHGLTFITKDESQYIVDKRLADFTERHISKRARASRDHLRFCRTHVRRTLLLLFL